MWGVVDAARAVQAPRVVFVFVGDSVLEQTFDAAVCQAGRTAGVAMAGPRRTATLSNADIPGKPITHVTTQDFRFAIAEQVTTHVLLRFIRNDKFLVDHPHIVHRICAEADALLFNHGLHLNRNLRAFARGMRSFVTQLSEACSAKTTLVYVSPLAQHFNRSGGAWDHDPNQRGPGHDACVPLDAGTPDVYASVIRTSVLPESGAFPELLSTVAHDDDEPCAGTPATLATRRLHWIPFFQATIPLFDVHKARVSRMLDCTHVVRGLTRVFDVVFDGLFVAVARDRATGESCPAPLSKEPRDASPPPNDQILANFLASDPSSGVGNDTEALDSLLQPLTR